MCTFLNDAFMERLFSPYSNLEKLNMQCCCGPKKIRIRSSKLRELVITYTGNFPYVNLEEFYIDDVLNLKVLTLRDTSTNLVTKKMKMNAQFSFIPVELDLKCNLEDARCVDGNGPNLKLK